MVIINIRDQVKQGVSKGILITIRDALNKFVPTIARKTGTMRDGYIQAVNEIIESKLNHPFVNFTITSEEIKQITTRIVDYAQYHFDTAPRTGLPYYKDPTTRGTEPMKNNLLITDIRMNINKNIAKELQNVGR